MIYIKSNENDYYSDMTTGYCVRCRKKRIIQNPKSITMKNGRPAVRGTCPTCNTKMFRIGKP